MTRRIAVLAALLLAAHSAAAEPPRRIVSLSPTVTEMLYGVGAFDRVVGVSNYCTYPDAVQSLARVGGWHNPSLEKLAALRPDLVIVGEAQAPFVEDKLRELGMAVLITPVRSIEDIFKAIEAIGHAVGKEKEATSLTASTRETLHRIRRKTAQFSKPRVLLVVDRTPGTLRDLYTATKGSFLAELIEIAGGQVAAPPAASGYGKIGKETLLAVDPDIILDFVHGAKSRLSGDPREAWHDMPELKAVRNGRVHGVSEDYVPHASHRIALTAALFARLIHPEAE